MPAGDLITDDYQLELNALLTGAGTEYHFGSDGIDGLGLAPAKTQDVDLAGRDGAYGNADFMAPRVLLAHYELVADDAETVMDLYIDLETAWQPRTTDVELHLQLPGMGHVFFVGRPRSLEIIATHLPSGWITAVAEFHALNPARQA